MKKVTKYDLIFWLIPAFLFCVRNTRANDGISHIVLEPLPVSANLTSKSINRIFQDNEGYIWFGTESQIYRYDGYKIKSYDTDADRSGQLANNEVLTFAESDAYIWVGTEQGIRIIDKTGYEISEWDYEPLINVRINYLMRDSRNNIWIGTQNGLYKYHPGTGKTEVYKYVYGDNNSLQGNGINQIYEDQDQNVWVLMWDCGLCRYVPERNNFDRYPEIPGRNNPFRIFQDKDKNYWLTTWGAGLFRFYPSAEGVNAYEKFEIRKPGDDNEEIIFFSIEQDDRYGYIWVVSYTGIFAITGVEDHAYKELSSASVTGSFNNLINDVMKDRRGNMWIGTYGNTVYIINMNKPGVVNYDLLQANRKFEITPSVSAMYQDDDGLLWLGLKRLGLHFFDMDHGLFVPWNVDPEFIRLSSLKEDVNHIAEIKSTGEIWVTFENDYTIFALKKQNGILKLVRQIDLHVDMNKHPLTENSISAIVEDGKNRIWIGTQAGVYLVDEKGVMKSVPDVMNRVTSVSEDMSGNVWIAGSDEGIACIKGSRVFRYKTENKKLQSNNIQSLYCQESGKVWAGSKKGALYVYNRTEDRFVMSGNELANEMDPIQDITEDKDGHLWVSMNKKIMEMDPSVMNSYIYTQDDGFMINPINKGAFFKSREGHVFFGGNQGFCYFPVSMLSFPVRNHSRVFITNVNLQEQSIFDTPYKNNLNLKKNELVLEPSQNNIEINFSSFGYFTKSKTEYAYKIDGIEDTWNYVSGNRYFATYNNLPKGKYTFMIKGRNEYGVWDDNTTFLSIYKKPHFYETWWAYLSYFLFFFWIVFYIYKSSFNRLKLKNELKIAQIEKNVSEQLVQTKLKYFTNVSHELMTPLTIISCLIDDVRKSSQADMWQFHTMLSNINRLKRLLQQILDFRKMESGNMTLKVQWGDIVAFTKEICESDFMPLFQRNRINFDFSASDEKIELYYDADKIDKVLFNLLSNAIKYTPEGGSITVRVETAMRDQEKFVRLIVNDTGKGIAPEELPNIFKRFYHSGKAKAEYSNGIGLSLTRELVEMHHGTIKVDSQLHAGTIFFVEIPINPNHYSENDFYSGTVADGKQIILTGSEEGIADPATGEKNEVTMLIVEDNPELRFILNKILAREYDTFMAENGKQALKIVNEQDINIVISDIAMPEMDGLELCRILKNNIETSHIPVLLITARNSIEDRVECYNMGADGYLSKPFEQQVLDAKIKSLIKNRKSRQEIFRNDVELNVATLEYPSTEVEFLNKIIELVKERYLSDNNLDPDVLAGELNLSRSSLYRKIKSLSNLSPSDFIRNIRLKQACLLLKDKTVSIKEVAFAVGFSDQRYFSSCFKSEFGITPTDFQKKQ